jgi:hypothetical protein
MIAFVRYTTGLGDAAIYSRLRNATGQFWDFVALSWGVIGADCKQFLTEYADSDPTTSYYAKEIVVPSATILCIEVVVDSTSLVLGYESTRDAGGYSPDTGAVVASGGNTAQSFVTDLASSVGNYCVGSFLKFISGTLINQVRRITAYNGTSKVVALSSAFTAIPTAADKFIIINQ